MNRCSAPGGDQRCSAQLSGFGRCEKTAGHALAHYDGVVRWGECEHDWRVNPHVTLTSNPPQQILVCLNCRQEKTRFFDTGRWGDDVAGWPKA